jgi:hypothetical protein
VITNIRLYKCVQKWSIYTAIRPLKLCLYLMGKMRLNNDKPSSLRVSYFHTNPSVWEVRAADSGTQSAPSTIQRIGTIKRLQRASSTVAAGWKWLKHIETSSSWSDRESSGTLGRIREPEPGHVHEAVVGLCDLSQAEGAQADLGDDTWKAGQEAYLTHGNCLVSVSQTRIIWLMSISSFQDFDSLLCY